MKRNQRGLTLVELLVALTILSVGLIAVTKMLMGAIAGNRFANYETSAVSLANQKLEELKEVPYENLVDEEGSETLKVGGLTYTRTLDVTPDITVGGTVMTRLTLAGVRVEWRDSAGPHNVSVMSYFSGYY